MTPQEKAKELINKMFNCDKSTPQESMAMLYPHAKQCALIAVDEILKSEKVDYLFTREQINSIEYTSDDLWIHETFTEYWTDVKQEIEKL